MPTKENKYFEYYKNFLKEKIIQKNIKKIYFFKHENISLKVITDYIDNKCYSNKENDLFYILKLECFN